jgi:hypothetical protein
MIYIKGMPVILSEAVDEPLVQYRFPKSKKKRIRRKWAKDKNNYKHQIFVYHDRVFNVVICGKLGYEQLKNNIEWTKKDTQCAKTSPHR